MRWMIRRYKRPGHDRGAVAIIVALLMAFGLLGLGAVAIDTGSWYAEKAQLQNGADGAALAIAQMCAAKTSDCTPAMAVPVAQDRANNNSNDSLSNVDFVCGSLLGSCPGSLCPTGSGNYVNVQTSTKTSTSASLPSLMSKALPGNSGSGETIHACAQASWGYPGSGNTVPMTISQCEWYDDTNNGATFAAPPPYLVAPTPTPWPPAWPYANYDPTASPRQVPTVGGEDVLALHGTANVSTNGDFETTPLGWGKTPNGSNGPTLSQNTDPAFVHDGAASLLVTWNTGVVGAESADDPNQVTTGGQVYVLSAWVYVPSGQPAVKLYAKGTAPAVYSPSQAGDNAWHRLSIEFTATGSRTDIGLVSNAATTGGQVAYLDTVVLALKTDPKCQSAPNPPSGFDQPGGFGWIYDPNNDCTAAIDVNNTTPDNTGASMDPACQSVLQADSCDPGSEPTPPCQPKVMFVPVYDGFCSIQSKTCDVASVCGNLPSQSNGCYHIKGFAAFVPTGFQLNGGGGLTQKSSISGTAYCKGNDKCVYGFFTHELVPFTGSICSDPACYLGIGIITLTG